MHRTMHRTWIDVSSRYKPEPMAEATISFFLDNRRIPADEVNSKNPKYPLRLQVYYQKKQFLVNTAIKVTQTVWNKISTGQHLRTHDEKVTSRLANERKSYAEEVAKNLKNITPDSFRKLFYSNQSIELVRAKTRLDVQYHEKIQELEADQKMKTKENYQNSLSSLQKFAREVLGKNVATLEDFTKESLKQYQRWMINQGNSISTTRTYLRPLRHIFNSAISKQVISKNIYPFGRSEFVIGSSVAAKKYLLDDELKQFYNFKVPENFSQRAKDFWWFCYLCNGCNPADALNLKHSNVHGDIIVFHRQKSLEHKNESKPVKVHYTAEMKKLVKKYQGKEYLWDVYEPGMSANRKHQVKATFQRNTNRSLARMSKLMNLRFPINLSMARPTYATVMKMSGAPTAYIADGMGHSSQKTTEIYFGGIPDDVVKNMSKNLTTFKKGKRSTRKLLKAV